MSRDPVLGMRVTLPNLRPKRDSDDQKEHQSVTPFHVSRILYNHLEIFAWSQSTNNSDIHHPSCWSVERPTVWVCEGQYCIEKWQICFWTDLAERWWCAACSSNFQHTLLLIEMYCMYSINGAKFLRDWGRIEAGKLNHPKDLCHPKDTCYTVPQ
jgi:hypothetical protein